MEPLNVQSRYRQNKYVLGIVVTTSPTCSLYRIVVFPAPSKPRIKILISLVPNRPEKRLEKKPPEEEEKERSSEKKG